MMLNTADRSGTTRNTPERSGTAPAAIRPHGTPARYDHGPDENDQPGRGCRCPRCRKGKNRRRKLAKLHQHRHGSLLVDAGQVREHVQRLRAEHGLDLHTIARAAGVNPRILDHLLYGVPSAGITPAKKIHRDKATAILAVDPRVVLPRTISGVGTQRRLRGLAAAGWTSAAMAPYVGLAPDTINRLTAVDPPISVRRETAERVRAAAHRLIRMNPVQVGIPEATVRRMRTIAARKGWVPLVAWDDIDDPAATPVGVRDEAVSA